MAGVKVDTGRLRDRVQQWGAEVVEHAVNALSDDVHENAPLGEDDPLGRRQGGELRESRFGPDQVSTYRWRIGYEAPQALFTDQGTRPHLIEAHGKVLVFWWDVTGQVEYRPRVFHPGYQPAFHWWSDVVTEENWYAYLERSRLEVNFL